MKKSIFLSFLFAIIASFAFAQTAQPSAVANASAALFKWEKTAHDFGKIEQNKPVTARFIFTNTGNSAMVISNAQGSCGCTGTTFPKEPIAIGEKAEITATFNAAVVGTFGKTVTVTANTPEGSVILSVQGEVLAAPANNNKASNNPSTVVKPNNN